MKRRYEYSRNRRYDPQRENLDPSLFKYKLKGDYYHAVLMEFLFNTQLFYSTWKQTNISLKGKQNQHPDNTVLFYCFRTDEHSPISSRLRKKPQKVTSRSP